jgi:hypothetical protein
VADSIFLAKLLGPVLLVVAAGALGQRDAFAAVTRDFLDHPALIYLSGLLAVPAGLAIVLAHNLWVADWRLLVTLFGWLMLLSGCVRLAAPTHTIRTGRRVLATVPQATTLAGAACLALGAVLTFCGFVR